MGTRDRAEEGENFLSCSSVTPDENLSKRSESESCQLEKYQMCTVRKKGVGRKLMPRRSRIHSAPSKRYVVGVSGLKRREKKMFWKEENGIFV